MRKALFLLCVTFKMCVIVLYVMFGYTTRLEPYRTAQCYHSTAGGLEDVTNADPKKNRTIFFIETSCRSHEAGKIVLDTRQACAIESAAKMNPNFDIYVLFVSPGYILFEDSLSDTMIRILVSYNNVHFKRINYYEYVKGSLVEDLAMSGKIEESKFQISHTSDMLRFLTLYKYGGIYLDLDVVVMKSFEDFPKNFAGDEGRNSINSCVVGFDHQGFGHELLEICLKDLNQNYDGNVWALNGPGAITRLLMKACNTNTTEEMTPERCNGFKIYPESAFYPVHWSVYENYFNETLVDEVDSWINNSYTIHLFSHVSNVFPVKVGSDAPYGKIAQKFCPHVYENCGEYF